MTSKFTRRQHYPQFERSPEAFPDLTIFPNGWDMSELIPSERILSKEELQRARTRLQVSATKNSSPFLDKEPL